MTFPDLRLACHQCDLSDDTDHDSETDENERQIQNYDLSTGFHFALAAFIRFTLLFYAVFHDQVFEVKYTDVDYIVFTDASRFVKQGRSPFLREGYRYTPLIAFLLVPNLFFSLFGKLLFLIFDLWTGYLIHRILTYLSQLVNRRVAHICLLTWLYNPLPLVVSTRGSSDSIETFLVLAVFYSLSRDRPVCAGFCYGLAVHIKLYPVIYAPIFYLFLMDGLPDGSLTSSHLWNPFTRKRLLFLSSAAATFFATTYACWLLYADRYLSEAWLYHLTRKDAQHNFSIYFYMYHLLAQRHHQLISSLAFVPQVAAILVICLTYIRPTCRSRDEFFARCLCASFQQTFLFVSLNKVITSQYFLWYLCLFPFILPFIPSLWHVSLVRREHSGSTYEVSLSRSFISVVVMWLSGQVMWLLPAYLYEFKRIDICLPVVWFASLAFLAINLVISAKLCPSFDPVHTRGKTN